MCFKNLKVVKLATVSIVLVSFLGLGCSSSSSGLEVQHLEFELFTSSIILDFPYGSSQIEDMPDNYSYDDPSTWTGGLAQYKKHNFFYYLDYGVKNLGGKVYDSELELYLSFDDESEEIKVIPLGDISAKSYKSGTESVFSTNKELVECYAEVHWYD